MAELRGQAVDVVISSVTLQELAVFGLLNGIWTSALGPFTAERVRVLEFNSEAALWAAKI